MKSVRTGIPVIIGTNVLTITIEQMYLQTLVILLSIENTFCDFLPVLEDCKYWDYLKVYGNGEEKNVHCIVDQNFQSGLVYTEWKIIPKGFCPIYNRFAGQIDSIPCNRNIGMCPNEAFPSYSGVTFTGCYDAIRKQTNVMRPTGNENVHVPPAVADKKTNVMRPTTNENVHIPPAVTDNCGILLPILMALATLAGTNCLFVIVCVWHFSRRSKIKLCRDTNQKQKERVPITISKPVNQQSKQESMICGEPLLITKEEIEWIS